MRVSIDVVCTMALYHDVDSSLELLLKLVAFSEQ